MSYVRVDLRKSPLKHEGFDLIDHMTRFLLDHDRFTFDRDPLSHDWYDPNRSQYYSEKLEGKIKYEIEMPGVAPKDISASVVNNVIIVTGMKKGDKLTHKLYVPKMYDVSTAQLELENGVLTITLDELEKVKPKELEIRVL